MFVIPQINLTGVGRETVHTTTTTYNFDPCTIATIGPDGTSEHIEVSAVMVDQRDVLTGAAPVVRVTVFPADAMQDWRPVPDEVAAAMYAAIPADAPDRPIA